MNGKIATALNLLFVQTKINLIDHNLLPSSYCMQIECCVIFFTSFFRKWLHYFAVDSILLMEFILPYTISES